MGMYTAFEFDAVLAKDAPHQVKSLLKTSIEGNNPIVPLPDHAFFKCERWFCLFTSGTFRFLEGDRIILRSWIKNYDDEIGKFVDWITPYLSALKGEMLGYKMYEETEWPTLLHHPNTWTPTGSLGPGEEW